MELKEYVVALLWQPTEDSQKREQIAQLQQRLKHLNLERRMILSATGQDQEASLVANLLSASCRTGSKLELDDQAAAWTLIYAMVKYREATNLLVILNPVNKARYAPDIVVEKVFNQLPLSISQIEQLETSAATIILDFGRQTIEIL